MARKKQCEADPAFGLFLLAYFFAFMAIMSLKGCGWVNTQRDVELERSFSRELSAFKKSGASSYDVSNLLGNKWEKICLQAAYEDQASFEKFVGRKVKGFEPMSDGDNTFWVFYPDGNAKWIRMKQVETMWQYSGSGQTSRCTTAAHPKLYSKWVRDPRFSAYKAFYFADLGKR